MQCPRCQTENPQEARYCSNCGNQLPPAQVPAAAGTTALPPVQVPAAAGTTALPPAQVPAAAGTTALPPVQAPAAAGTAPSRPAVPAAAPGAAPAANWLRANAGRPLHQLLLIGAGICLLSLFFFATSTTSRVVATPGGYWQTSTYSDGRFAHSDFIPQAEFSVIPGSSGSNAPSWLPIILIGAGAFWLRKGNCPRWVRYAMMVLAAWVALTALDRLLYVFGFGALLYAVGAVAISLGGYRLLRSRAA